MVPSYGRSSWGALPPNRNCGVMQRCEAIVLHHTVGLHPTNIPAAHVEMRRLQREALAKVKPSGDKEYCDIPYNLVCGPQSIFVGRGPTINDGATDNDLQTDTVSVSVMGNFAELPVTDDYLISIRDAVALCRLVWGPLPVRPHHDYYNTQCPGSALDAIIPYLNGADEMTEEEFFTHPLTLLEGEPPAPREATVQDWFEWVHREFQVMRLRIEEIARKP